MIESETRAPARLGVAPAWASTGLLAAEWACVLAAAGLWASERPPQGVVLLGIPLWLAAWALRWLRVGRLTRPTALDWPLLIFMLSALVGVWAAPSQPEALARLDLFLGATGLYYLLANSPRNGRVLFGLGLAALAALLAVYFASQNDWANVPAKFALIGQVGRQLNQHLPQLHLYQPNPNVIANALALTLPVAVVLCLSGLAGWGRARWSSRLAALFAGLCALVVLAGLVMSESRASALALGGAAALAAWWWLARRLAGQAWLALFLGGVGLGVLAAVALAIAKPDLLTRGLGSLPGPNSAISRTELYAQVWRLAQEAPFTGGGLAAFPGLYSTYILGVPNLYLTHAHNAYLNVLVEQGWPGLLSFVAVLIGALVAGGRRWAGRAKAPDILVAAGLLGLAVLVVQALGDGTLVASRVALVWLVPAGLAVGGLRPGTTPADPRSETPPRPAQRWPTWLPWAAGLMLAAGAALLTWHGWLAAWYANLGEVAFARIQLERWPSDQWSTGQEAPRLAALQPVFEHALALNPANETALYRLGLLAGLQRDYPGAIQRLAPAQQADPGHRGLNKTLAYAYVWTGDLPDARPLLKTVPEAANEMSVYVWWWGTQGRPDLADRARAAVADLSAAH